jgi:hypothetical protein
MADNKLLEGIRLFKKKDSQPDFVLATGVITPNALVAFLKANPDLLSEYNGEKQVRIQVLKSKDGNPYVAVDTWKPDAKGNNENIPVHSSLHTTNGGPGYVAPTEEELNDLPF